MPNWLPDRVRPASPLGRRPEFPAHAGLTEALSRLIQRPGDDESRARDGALPVDERIAGDLTEGAR
jgi:hypothetical protein